MIPIMHYIVLSEISCLNSHNTRIRTIKMADKAGQNACSRRSMKSILIHFVLHRVIELVVILNFLIKIIRLLKKLKVSVL